MTLFLRYSLILFMGFFYTCPNPAVSTVQEERMQEIKNCRSQDSKHQRDATAWGMKQHLSTQQMCFLSCLSSAVAASLQNRSLAGSTQPQLGGDAVLSSFSFPQHPLALLPQPHGTEDSHAQRSPVPRM